MKKICLSDSDADFFADELNPIEFDFFQKHKEAFKCMWIEQGKSFWTKFIITFRSYTSRHGIVKDMPYESERLKDIMDFAFIVVHENFIDGSASAAQNFLIDIARLAQNKDKLPNLDSKKFAKDPFYRNETRDIFRMFFGPPTEKVSYIKVYILFPVYLRLCGSICRCLIKWIDAEKQDPDDVSYWTPPEPLPIKTAAESDDPVYLNRVLMCENCIDMCGMLFFQEMECGSPSGPKYLSLWKYGNPRHEVKDNPLYDKSFDGSDWRDGLNIDEFRDFNYFLNVRYAEIKCPQCEEIRNNKERIFAFSEGKMTRKSKKSKRSLERKPPGGKEVFDGRITFNDRRVDKRKYIYGFDASNPGVKKDLVAERMPNGRQDFFTPSVKVTENRQDNITPSGECSVVKITNEKQNMKETTICVTCKHAEPMSKKKISELKTDKYNIYSPYLIPNLPQMFEWAEGRGWCAAVFNYEDEEKKTHKNFTNFALKVSGNNKTNVINIFDSLVKYVVSRKNRSPCPGWVLDEDDVLTIVMGKKSFKAMTIIIMDGMEFRDFLTDWEKRTESKLEVNHEEINDVIKSVLKKFVRKPNLLVEEPTVNREIGEGWKQYYDIVKRVRDCCDFPRECRLAIGKRCLVDIDITQGKIDFSLSDKERFPDSYYPDLEQLDTMYLKAWLKLEKLGVQTKGSAVDLYILIQQKQKAALREAERDKIKNGKCDDPVCANHRRNMSSCQHHNIKIRFSEFQEGSHNHLCCPFNDIAMKRKALDKTIEERKAVEQSVKSRIAHIHELGNSLSMLDIEKEVAKNDVTIKLDRKQLKSINRGEKWKHQDDEDDDDDDMIPPLTKFFTTKRVDKKELKGIKNKTVNGTTTNSHKPQPYHRNGNSRNSKDDDDDDMIPPLTKFFTTKRVDKKEIKGIENKTVNGATTNSHKPQTNHRNGNSRNSKEERNDDDEDDDDESTTSEEEDDKEEISVNLRICYFCNSTEPVFRTYKKCQRCQQEKIVKSRYYCGRDCQIKDWEEKHRKEHLENLLK